MKSFNELKLRSKLPQSIQSEARRIEGFSKLENYELFEVEQVDVNELRFLWIKVDSETGCKSITNILQFILNDTALASKIMKRNNPQGAIGE